MLLIAYIVNDLIIGLKENIKKSREISQECGYYSYLLHVFYTVYYFQK